MATFNSTWKHIRRSPYQALEALAAIVIMTLTFMVAGFVFLLSLGSAFVIRHFEQKPQLIVFFSDTKDESEIQTLENKLKQSESVASVKYVSKDEALKIYEEQFKNDPLLLEMVSAEILPASLEISTKQIDDLSQIAESLKGEEEISEIVFPEDVISTLSSWVQTLRLVGFGLAIGLSIASLFTIITVIGMKIALKSNEIEILRLVGAGSGYIRSPFVMEGMFYGITGAAIGALINIGLLIYTSPFLTGLLTGIPIFPIPLMFYGLFAAGMVLGGGLFGMLASLVAINRYLGRRP
jgi:cell division transport system permease protein